MKTKICVTALLIAGAGMSMADTVNWPVDSFWNPLYSQGIFFSDIQQDTGNNGHLHLDIVGDATYAGASLLYRAAATTPGETEDQLLVRIRVNSSKQKMPGAYQVFFETDGDASVEWVLQLTTDDLDTSGTLEFGSASGTNRNGVAFGSVDWTGTYAGNVHWTGTATSDGSLFDGDDDYFLDMSIPWTTFSGLTGITSTNDPFRMLITTSQTGGQISDGDIGNSSVAANVDFSFSAVYTDTVPEPSSIVLTALFGSGLFIVRRRFRR